MEEVLNIIHVFSCSRKKYLPSPLNLCSLSKCDIVTLIDCRRVKQLLSSTSLGFCSFVPVFYIIVNYFISMRTLSVIKRLKMLLFHKSKLSTLMTNVNN